jgi:hypothetical protein
MNIELVCRELRQDQRYRQQDSDGRTPQHAIARRWRRPVAADGG